MARNRSSFQGIATSNLERDASTRYAVTASLVDSAEKIDRRYRSKGRAARPAVALVGRFPASLTGSLAKSLAAAAAAAASRARGLRSQRFTVAACTRRNAARCTRVRVTRAIHSTESAVRV